QAEDGIRGFHVTGVQTCALPIFRTWRDLRAHGTRQVVALSDTPAPGRDLPGCVEQAAGGDYVEACAYEPGASASPTLESAALQEIGRASCRERAAVCAVTGTTRT